MLWIKCQQTAGGCQFQGGKWQKLTGIDSFLAGFDNKRGFASARASKPCERFHYRLKLIRPEVTRQIPDMPGKGLTGRWPGSDRALGKTLSSRSPVEA